MSTQASIRVESKNKYAIEVNDNGDTISFDLSDFSLPAKLLNVYNNLEELTSKYDKENKAILEREDEVLQVVKTLDEKGKEIETSITKNQMDIIKLTDQYYTDARKALDEFLGENACQKIFGESNYMDMFDDLMEQLAPHFEKMGLNIQKMQKGLTQKYKQKNSNILK